MRLALVLGAGGLVGVAHHAGVLCALAEHAGFEDAHAEVVIGTSAGSAVAAYLRTGWAPQALMDRAADLHEAAAGPLAGSAFDLVRRGIGSAYVLARATTRIPSLLSLAPTPALRRAFPAGVATMGGAAGILERELPRTWPRRQLWLTAYDLVNRRRVVLGRPGEPYLTLSAAVRASCAIPGVYAPVRAADGVLVDGGAWSLTNLDLVSLAGCDAVICVAPMAFDPKRPPGARERLVREVSTRAVSRACERLRAQGIGVVTLLPGPHEVAVHGVNLMRSGGLDRVADVAYEETRKHLRLHHGRELGRLLG